ncbi:hypothetical protein HGRIS_004299 [Hohenbuehelia grisea]|uniref:Uncharacterized protein n=1 Tax=Hohenbuehelia grisea TaxID=104357 RepID=A0ABR3IPG0_9AGAR
MTCALKLPNDSPPRSAQNLFWSILTNKEGIYLENGFHGLVNVGKNDLVSPTKVTGYDTNGRSFVLRNEKTLEADAVILVTGFTLFWKGIISRNRKRLWLEPPRTQPERMSTTSRCGPMPWHGNESGKAR